MRGGTEIRCVIQRRFLGIIAEALLAMKVVLLASPAVLRPKVVTFSAS